MAEQQQENSNQVEIYYADSIFSLFFNVSQEGGRIKRS